jgi:hypothetical protein
MPLLPVISTGSAHLHYALFNHPSLQATWMLIRLLQELSEENIQINEATWRILLNAGVTYLDVICFEFSLSCKLIT